MFLSALALQNLVNMTKMCAFRSFIHLPEMLLSWDCKPSRKFYTLLINLCTRSVFLLYVAVIVESRGWKNLRRIQNPIALYIILGFSLERLFHLDSSNTDNTLTEINFDRLIIVHALIREIIMAKYFFAPLLHEQSACLLYHSSLFLIKQSQESNQEFSLVLNQQNKIELACDFALSLG